MAGELVLVVDGRAHSFPSGVSMGMLGYPHGMAVGFVQSEQLRATERERERQTYPLII